MKTLRTTLLALAMLSGASAMAQIPFKVLEGGSATSGRKTLDVVCQTSPHATATINGKEAHVYKTGAFGLPVQLSEGENKIDIALTLNGQTEHKTLNVRYVPGSTPRQGSGRPQPVEKAFEMDGITCDNAAIAYGNGSDRLGGSKMTYLVDDIPVKVIAEYGNQYKLRLSQNRFAYVAKSSVKSCKEAVCGPMNSENIRIVNKGDFDVVTLPLPQRTTYYSWMELDPTVLYVDVFNVMNNSNWITHMRDLEAIEYVDCQQVESDVLRLAIRLRNTHSWGYHIYYDRNVLTIMVKHAPRPTLAGMVIGLDAGHGGPESNGAISVTGAKEKELNLDIVYRLKALLEERGARVVLTRTKDEGISMADRRKILWDSRVDLLVSIHNNASGSIYKPMGTSCYYKYIQNRELAACILDRILEFDDVPNMGLVGNFNFALGTPTEYPAMLVEGLFVSSMPDEEKLLDPNFRQQLAVKVLTGLEDYLGKVQAKP